MEQPTEEPLQAAVCTLAVDGPVAYTADGSFLVHSVLTPDPVHPAPVLMLSLIESTGVIRTFDIGPALASEKASDRFDYDVGTRDVIFLMQEIQEKYIPGTLPRYLLARFDRRGGYQGTVPLAIGHIKPLKVAVFDSGDLLIFGMDTDLGTAQLTRYSPIGHQITRYQPDTPFATRNAFTPKSPVPTEFSNETLASMQAEDSAALSQMMHFKDSILLLQMNAGSPIFSSSPTEPPTPSLCPRSRDLPRIP